MFAALKPGFRSLATVLLNLQRMLLANFKPKRTPAASRGFLQAGDSTAFLLKILLLLRSAEYLQQNITDLLKSQRCRYTSLWNINFQKLRRPKAQQRQTKCIRNEENVTAIDELVLTKAITPATNLSFNTPNTACCHMDYFFSSILARSV